MQTILKTTEQLPSIFTRLTRDLLSQLLLVLLSTRSPRLTLSVIAIRRNQVPYLITKHPYLPLFSLCITDSIPHSFKPAKPNTFFITAP
jgi:hypothetical protein